jgi:hypothetical protein
MVLFLLHLADRVGSGYLSEPQRAFFTDRVVELTLVFSAEEAKILPESAEFEIFGRDFIKEFNARQDEYQHYHFPQAGQSGVKDTLYWEFAEKIARIMEVANDPRIIVPLYGFVVESSISLKMNTLVTGGLS